MGAVPQQGAGALRGGGWPAHGGNVVDVRSRIHDTVTDPIMGAYPHRT